MDGFFGHRAASLILQRWIRAGRARTVLACLPALLFTPHAGACSGVLVGQTARACEPYARIAWMPAETQAMVGGVGIALGLARLNPAGLAMTGHDTGLASVVPVLSIRAAPALSNRLRSQAP